VVPDTTGTDHHTGRMLLLDPRSGRQVGTIPMTGMPAEGGDTTVATGGWIVLLGRGTTVFAPT
jgi:hypothetical protein